MQPKALMTRRLYLLVTLLVLSGCGSEVTPQAEPIYLRIVDAEGEPAQWAQVLLRRAGQDVASKWDEAKATLILPRESAPHGVRITAEGHRLLYVNDIRGDQTITLRRGPRVQIALADHTAQMPEFRTLLLRIRPWFPGDPETDAGLSAKISLICDLMWLVQGQEQGSLPRLPTRHWGFGVAPVDAQNGFYVPVPGTYVAQWGLLDLDEGTWYTVEENASLRFEVKDQAEPQTFTMVVDEETLQATDLGLQQRIDAIHAAEAAAKEKGENTSPDADEAEKTDAK